MASVGRMEKVLCVCVGNISRSPIMHAVLQQHLGAGFRVESAGISKEMAGRPANARSVACMNERGVDLTGHISRWIGDLDLDQYRWIVCVGHDEADTVRSAVGADSASSWSRTRTKAAFQTPTNSGWPVIGIVWPCSIG